ncbi:MAG: hypothetical protein HN360_00085 [Rhodospirillaceae bacterium]|nr:hypothetical protein [Rhodospirillaceae bacterium]MBT4220606.1 hypothetical protein [Rhodospirillaceae bacterium]MBT4464615.1 hypothetical protein [Rhodospirillaceae bacterium]MBT5013566.1 hypothetical protein [Rhodospirillaceae bacterium]MBT7355436.1 hypothetical protein [Rhodospirillaceae bacterium]
MLGLIYYSLIAAGLGCLAPISLRSGMAATGIRFSLGYALMVIVVYVSHILLGLSFGITLAVTMALSVAGIVAETRRQGGHSAWRELVVHPAFILILAGAGAIALNGGIGYLPYGNDEFSHWLATPQIIHLSGSWAAVVDTLVLPFYTPGWQLTLLMPWQLLGNEDLGMSAAAPFVLHVTVIALVYDIVVFQLRQRTQMTQVLATLAAWAFVLLFMTAEAMGRLWTYTLLIEQPQIYSYVAVLLTVYAAQSSEQNRKTLYGVAGIILASAYLYKAAAMTFIPAVIGAACIVLLLQKKNFQDQIKDNLVMTGLLVGPILIAIYSWSATIQSSACSPFSLSSAQIDQVASLDWTGLAVRFFSEVGTYVVGYKSVLTVAASLGFIGAFALGKYRAALMTILLFAGYLLALYLYHLTCLGSYYFEQLASIPRFTRVPLQVFHALGLVMLLDVALSIFFRTKGSLNDAGGNLLGRSWVMTGLAAVVIILGIWQARQIHNTVIDTTTRAHQSIDPRINEMRMAANKIEALRDNTFPDTPVLTILSQGDDNAVIDYARFFAMGYEDGKRAPRFLVSYETSWAPDKKNVWQTQASMDEAVQYLSRSDIIWPIALDPWLTDVLAQIVPDAECLNSLPDKALIRETSRPGSIRYQCIDKH